MPQITHLVEISSIILYSSPQLAQCAQPMEKTLSRKKTIVREAAKRYNIHVCTIHKYYYQMLAELFMVRTKMSLEQIGNDKVQLMTCQCQAKPAYPRGILKAHKIS